MTDEYVSISKMRAVDTPFAPTPNQDEFKPGGTNPGFSLPVEYTITGLLVDDIKVGLPVRVSRDTRNGVVASGLFYTSPVVEITTQSGKLVFKTQNSVYELTWIEKLDKNKGDSNVN